MGSTALHIAARKNNVEMMQVLLSVHPPINAKHRVSWYQYLNEVKPVFVQITHETCLHIACKRNHIDMIAILLRNGADMKARNKVRFYHGRPHKAQKAGEGGKRCTQRNQHGETHLALSLSLFAFNNSM